jgi:hypothetical protein
MKCWHLHNPFTQLRCLGLQLHVLGMPVSTLMVSIAAWQRELLPRYHLLLIAYHPAIFVQPAGGGSKKGKLHAYVAHRS